jgi:hypothetical protein
VEVLRDGPGVDVFVFVLAGDRTADDVPPGVTTGLLGRETAGFQFLEYLGDVLEFDPVELDGLAGRPVAVGVPELGVLGRPRGVLLGHLADDLELARLDDAVGRPDAHHEVALLTGPLVVQPPPLEPLEPRVVFVLGNRVPTRLGELHEVFTDLVSVHLVFPLLDLRWHCESVYTPHLLTLAFVVKPPLVSANPEYVAT